MTDKLAGVLLCLLVAALSGCNGLGPAGAKAPNLAAPPAGTIPAAEMGNRLGLAMRGNSSCSVTVGDQVNSVVFFSDPGGKAYVNGRLVGRQGGLAAFGGTVYVPESLESEIRMAMRTAPKTPKRPKRPVQVRKTTPSSHGPVLKYGPVVIDAGHGGDAPGTIQNGHQEKRINLLVALLVAEKLKAAGVDARLTRSTDASVDLNDRAAMSNSIGAKLFVSLHCDSAPNRRARGFTIYAPETRQSQSAAFASIMEKSMRTTSMTSRGVRHAGFRVLVRTRCPALLVEMGYLSNRYDAGMLNSRSYQRSAAQAIANAVIRYLTK